MRRPSRRGRFLIWPSGGLIHYYLRFDTIERAKAALPIARQASASATTTGFDLPEESAEWRRGDLSADQVLHALKAVPDAHNGAIAFANERVANGAGHAMFLFGGISLVVDGLALGSWPENALGLVSGLLLILVGTLEALSSVKMRPRRAQRARLVKGALQGMDWGPVAIRANAEGIEIRRNAHNVRYAWAAVKSVTGDGTTTVLTDHDGFVRVLPYIEEAPRLLAADRRRRGESPWTAHHLQTLTESDPLAEVPIEFRPLRLLRSAAIWIAIFVATIAGFFAGFARPASAELLKSPTIPAWHQTVSVAEWRALTNDLDGKNDVLMDIQTRAQATRFTRVMHQVVAVQSRTELEQFGRIQLPVSATRETPTLHKLAVHRGDRVISQMDLTFLELPNETALEDGIYSGDVDYKAQILDLRPGDFIEVIWSVTASTPVTPHGFYYRLPPPPGEVSVLHRNTVEIRAERPVEVSSPPTFTLERTSAGGWDRYSWTPLFDPDAAKETGPEPEAWDPSQDPVEITTFADWASVVDGFA